jgi:dihydropyrimidine dehydrogenase (NAD+) subunit PreA
VIASLMVESKREAWHEIVKRSEDAGADGLELNFGCPHGMSERGMGSAVGQVPDTASMITEWVKEGAHAGAGEAHAQHHRHPRRRARRQARRRRRLSAINTINSITGIDLDTFTPRPNVGGLSSHGGYCGPAVKPIALNMVQQIARPASRNCPSRHRRHFQLARRRRIHPAGLRHRAGLHRRHALRLPHRRRHDRRPQQLDGRKRLRTIEDFRGLSLPKVTEWKHLDLNYKIVARINPRRNASAASSATSPAGTARTSAFIWTARPRPKRKASRG